MNGIGVQLVGDWGKANQILGDFDARFKQASERAMLQEAQFLRKEIVTYLREGGVLPLNPKTLAVRAFTGFKGSKPLIRTADMRNAIQVTRVGDAVFVGILRTARSKGGRAIMNVAQLQEQGGTVVVPITAKSRKFYHAALAKAGLSLPKSHGSGGGAAIAIVHIPPRPFMAPAFEKWGKPDEVRARFFARLAKLFF